MNPLKSLSLAATAVALTVSGAQAAEKVVWNYAIYGPPRAITKQIEHVAKYIEEKSGGNFTFRLGYAESISPARETLDSIKLGAIEGGLVAYSYAPGKTPLNLVLDLPYLPIPNLVVQEKIMEDFNNWEPAKQELLQWNAVTLYGLQLPMYEFMGVGKAPKTLADWKGMRVRSPGPGGDAMRALGAVPTSMPAPEVYTALERGVIQAAAFPFSYTFAAYRLHEISRWYTYGLNFNFLHNGWLANKASYDALPAEYKQMLEDVRTAQYEVAREAFKEADAKYIPEYDKRLERITISPEMLAEYQAIGGKPVWEKWIADTAAKGLPAQEAFDLVLASAAKHADAK